MKERVPTLVLVIIVAIVIVIVIVIVMVLVLARGSYNNNIVTRIAHRIGNGSYPLSHVQGARE